MNYFIRERKKEESKNIQHLLRQTIFPIKGYQSLLVIQPQKIQVFTYSKNICEVLFVCQAKSTSMYKRDTVFLLLVFTVYSKKIKHWINNHKYKENRQGTNNEGRGCQDKFAWINWLFYGNLKGEFHLSSVLRGEENEASLSEGTVHARECEYIPGNEERTMD